jgi:hypothetical protein
MARGSLREGAPLEGETKAVEVQLTKSKERPRIGKARPRYREGLTKLTIGRHDQPREKARSGHREGTAEKGDEEGTPQATWKP